MSSLIFAALAVAWLAVLVPMFARRRQEISRTADSTLASRVVRRIGQRPVAGSADACAGHAGDTRTISDGLEEQAMPQSEDYRTPEDSGVDGDEFPYTEDDFEDESGEFPPGPPPSRRRAESNALDRNAAEAQATVDAYESDNEAGVDGRYDAYDDAAYDGDYPSDGESPDYEERRYRPGRGGFNPEAAAATARAKYVRRQRVVLTLILLAVVTAVLAAVVQPVLWWVHGAVDLLLIGYLTYLRRQVRIEEAVRSRRMARMQRVREADLPVEEPLEPEIPEQLSYVDEPEVAHPQARRWDTDWGTEAIVVELDDDDPEFDELDERTWRPYRRVAGE